jgi:hypothetical protein
MCVFERPKGLSGQVPTRLGRYRLVLQGSRDGAVDSRVGREHGAD